MGSELLVAALEYLRMGYSVIPVRAAKKGGALMKWAEFQRRRPTEDEVRKWFGPGSRATGVAIVTGIVSGCIGVDFDRHGADDGVEVARTVYGWQPEGPVVQTPTTGLHAYSRHPGGKVPNAVGILPGVDVRGDGGFLYAPPSQHPSGGTYEWLEPLVPPHELPPMPEWVATALAGEVAPTPPENELLELLRTGVAEGRRNDTAARLAGYYLAQGLDGEAVLLMLQAWNQRNRPPLPEEELAKVVESIDKKERAKRGEVVQELDRDLALQAIAERLDVPLENIYRIGGSRPRYRFVLNGQYADVFARDIGSQWAWAREMIALTGHVPKTLKPAQWRRVLQQMLNVAEPIDPGPEATEVGELREWLKAYLETMQVRDEGEAASLPEEPCRVGGRICIHAGHLRRFVRARFDVNVEGKQLVQQLSALGFERQTVNVTLSDGNRTTRSMWVVPPQFVEACDA